MKVWNYMMIMMTMMIFLFFLGFQPAGADVVLSDSGISINATTGKLVTGNVVGSAWYKDLFHGSDAYLFLISAAVIVIGLYTRTFEWKAVFVPFFLLFVVKFMAFGWGLVTLVPEEEGWLVAIIATVFLPLTAMFLFSVIEWFGGTPSD